MTEIERKEELEKLECYTKGYAVYLGIEQGKEWNSRGISYPSGLRPGARVHLGPRHEVIPGYKKAEEEARGKLEAAVPCSDDDIKLMLKVARARGKSQARDKIGDIEIEVGPYKEKLEGIPETETYLEAMERIKQDIKQRWRRLDERLQEYKEAGEEGMVEKLDVEETKEITEARRELDWARFREHLKGFGDAALENFDAKAAVKVFSEAGMLDNPEIIGEIKEIMEKGLHKKEKEILYYKKRLKELEAEYKEIQERHRNIPLIVRFWGRDERVAAMDKKKKNMENIKRKVGRLEEKIEELKKDREETMELLQEELKEALGEG